MKYLPSIIAASALALLACKEKAAPKSEPAKTPVESAAKPAIAAPDTFKAALGRVYDGYIGIQEALAQDDFGKAKEAFSSMHGLLHMMPKEGLDSMARTAWDSSDARMMASLHPMASSKDIEDFRTHFAGFSDAMADAVEKFGTDGAVPIYQMHCPMAKGNQGADWLQKDKEVSNPYFGGSMLKCGELVREFKG